MIAVKIALIICVLFVVIGAIAMMRVKTAPSRPAETTPISYTPQVQFDSLIPLTPREPQQPPVSVINPQATTLVRQPQQPQQPQMMTPVQQPQQPPVSAINPPMMIPTQQPKPVVQLTPTIQTVTYTPPQQPQLPATQTTQQPQLQTTRVLQAPQATYIGCYVDKAAPNRALTQKRAGANTSTLNQCIDFAKSAGSKLFGFQYGDAAKGTGECWAGTPSTTLAQAQRWGASQNCRPVATAYAAGIKNANVGGAWSFGLYQI